MNNVRKIWDVVATIAAVFIVAAIVCYFRGVTMNWILVAFVILGAWAIHRLYPMLGRPVVNTAKTTAWYLGAVTTIICTLLIVANSSLLGMYEDWSTLDRTWFGAVRIFAPMIAIIVGSVVVAVEMKGRRLIVSVVTTCVVVSVIALLLNRLVKSSDNWLASFFQTTAQRLEEDTTKMDGNLGMFAVAKHPGVRCYKEVHKNSEYKAEKEYSLECNKRYPVVSDARRKDGPHKLVRIYLPEGESSDFNNQSLQRWVRLDEVNVTSNPDFRKKTDGWKTVFEQEYTGQGFGKNDWVPTAEFGKDIQIGYRTIITGNKFSAYDGRIWENFQGQRIKINNTGTSNFLGVKAPVGEKFRVEVQKRT